MGYCEVLQRGGAKVYRCAIKAPRVTRTGTKGTGRALQSGCSFRVTPDLVQHTQHCHRSTMGKITVKHSTSYKAGTTHYAVQ